MLHNNNMKIHIKMWLVLHLVLCSRQLANANPVNGTILNFKGDIVQPNRAEIDDMNLQILHIQDDTAGYPSSREFVHRDQDQTTRNSADVVADANATLTLTNRLKYDVEELEPLNDKQQRDGDELEERFQGVAALQAKTNTLTMENIEIGPNDIIITDADIAIAPHNRLVLTSILIVLAMVSVSLYAVLVIWRSRLERRYGMRQLLATTNDDDDRFADAPLPAAEHQQQRPYTPIVYA